MKLQLALDGDLNSSIEVLHAVHSYIDIAEIGTPLIIREGMHAVARIRELFPSLALLADLKIMDAGEEEAALAFKAGCDVVTVLGVTQDATIQGAVRAAQYFGKQVMIDMMQVADIPHRARHLLSMGCHYLCLHTAYDVYKNTDQSPLFQLEALRRILPDAPLAIAGGIGATQIDEMLSLKPAVIIVGGAITRAQHPAEIASTIRRKMEAS